MTKGLHELRSGVECVDGRRGGTGRKRAEAHRLTFDQAAVGIAHIGLDLRIQQANPCLCAMTGCSMEELSGMSLVELLHPEDRLVAAEERREVLAGAPSHTTEKRNVRKDGGG